MTTSPNAVPANAFATVTLSDAAKHWPSGSPHEVIFRRGKPQPNEPSISFRPSVTIGPHPPERLPSKLPEKGDLKLHLSLGRKISYGRAARVYEVEVDLERSSSLGGQLLPALAVKISRYPTARSLAREAFYYEEMECLQGSVIPRYYGLLKATVPADVDFLPWENDLPKRPNPSAGQDGSSDDDDYELDPPRAPTVVTIIVMERLGLRIPLGKRLPESVLEDVKAMYADLGHLGIDHVDIRYYNILQAPSPPNSSPLPSLPSPFSGRVYGWRLVDFDKACKANRTQESFEYYYNPYVERLIDNLPYGEIWEPWEY